ncbi:hypothetical protein DUHN55_16680 [Helicobacter pylori]|uniref:hypothetical protein n=1 Tax=unclassified Janibacter TaxID=2649294 RepID=UPI0020CBBD2A|nr:hypothetical protein [Janibacter sp. CX7]UTT66642.1 hypothetical protein NMQ01_02700 [Janibacter sp. CX7]
MSDREQPMSVRATAARWALGALLVVGALVLLLKPGGLSKLLALVLAGAAVAIFTRRSRSDATVVTVVLLVVAAVYVGAFLSGNSHWITDRY